VKGRTVPRGAVAVLLAAIILGVPQGHLQGAGSPAQATDLLSAVTLGQFYGQGRYRFEEYEQASTAAAPIVGVGKASTFRVDLGYRTAPFDGLSFFADLNGVFAVGSDLYRIATLSSQNKVGFPTINDPTGTDLHQLELVWSRAGSPVRFKIGRDELQLNNGRFIGNSLWRQTPQTVDLAQVGLSTGGGLELAYTYMARVHRTLGRNATDGTLSMDSHLATAGWSRSGVISASAYGLWLNYDRPDEWIYSTSSLGLRVTGPYPINADWSVVYTADFARQRNFAHNPNRVSEPYWDYELGVSFRGESALLGWTVLGARSATDILTTPLSPPFNGWVEKFGPNPAVAAGAGENIRYASLSGPVPAVPGLTHVLVYYEYYADTTKAHFGSEVDFALEWKAAPIGKALTLGLRFGAYRADTLYSNCLRDSIYAVYAF